MSKSVSLISEALLIEIALRFRALEDQIELADMLLAGEVGKHSDANETLEARHASGKLLYDEWCRRSRPHAEAIEKIELIRDGVERMTEACRDDMFEMQEIIRRLQQ